jgi:hypothetical protein
MADYKINISFSTDRKMTDYEIAHLETSIYTAVNEPSGIDYEKRADYNTTKVDLEVVEVEKVSG